MLIKNIIRNLPIIAAVITMASCSVGVSVPIDVPTQIVLNTNPQSGYCTASESMSIIASGIPTSSVVTFTFNGNTIESAASCTIANSGTCSVSVACDQFALGVTNNVVASTTATTQGNPIFSGYSSFERMLGN